MQIYNDIPQRHAEKKSSSCDMPQKRSKKPLHSSERVVAGTAPVLVVRLAPRRISAFGGPVVWNPTSDYQHQPTEGTHEEEA